MRGMGVMLALAISLGAMAEAAAKPRVMSFDMCTDQLLLALAEPEQIVSVTPSVFRDRLSLFADRARALHLRANRLSAEEAARFSPDVIFLGARGGKTALTLKAMGLRVERFLPPTSVDEAIALVRRAGRILEQPAATARVVAAIEAARDRARRAAPAVSPAAMMYLPGGYGLAGKTLLSDMLGSAGIRNLLAEGGRVGMARLSLESMVLMHPDLVLVNDPDGNGAPRQATVLLAHPALRHAVPDARQVIFPSRLWLCGGAQTARGLDYLVDRVLPETHAKRER